MVVKNSKPRNAPETGGRAEQKPGMAARSAAARILAAVIDKKTSLDGMFDNEGGNPAYRALPDDDRALVRAMVQACLRHYGIISEVLSSYLKNPLPEGARTLQHVLAIGATQILFLDVPDHAAVDLAVEQAASDPRTRRFANLVNALLRRMGREREDILARGESPDKALPGWMMARLVKAHGREQALAIASACMQMPPIDITVKYDPDGWAAKLGGVVLPTGSVRLKAGHASLTELEGFADGSWWVQDAAAAIPALLFGDLAGKRVVDLCAAPGGKTAQLILAGADVTALDQSASRIRRLETNLARLGLNATTFHVDMADYQPDTLFDAALLDAPCSSTGTIRRHPDIAWTKTPADITKLAGVQRRLLDKAISLVKPGGTIVFSNCSLDAEEGEELVAKLLAERDDIRRMPVDPARLSGLEGAVNAQGDVRTTPAMIAPQDGASGGMDGFFACVLQRVA